MITKLQSLVLLMSSMVAISSSLSTLTSSSLILSHELSHECESNNNSINITEVLLDPFPLLRGKKSLMTTIGTFITPQVLKSVKVDVYFGSSSIYTDEKDLSGSYNEGDLIEIAYPFNIPYFAPLGDYVARAVVINSNGDKINCWETNLSL